MSWSNGLAEWIEDDTAYLSVAFSWRLSDAYQRAAWYRAQGYRVRAGGADLSDVAHVLGHSQVQTTYQFYGRWDAAELHALHDRYTWLPSDVTADTAPTAGVDA